MMEVIGKAIVFLQREDSNELIIKFVSSGIAVLFALAFVVYVIWKLVLGL